MRDKYDPGTGRKSGVSRETREGNVFSCLVFALGSERGFTVGSKHSYQRESESFNTCVFAAWHATQNKFVFLQNVSMDGNVGQRRSLQHFAQRSNISINIGWFDVKVHFPKRMTSTDFG
ncbi:hypothetical protein NQZ68_022033 [Dissostichus eleginoides]|nr:hypothetical protein NQZ68_022033 [Dissostichus eleginoides]